MMLRWILLGSCLIGCDTPEKVGVLQGRVDALEAKLAEAEKQAKASNEAADKRVTELEKRVASSEAEASALAEAAKAEAARVDALRLQVEALELKIAKGVVTPPEVGGGVTSFEKIGVAECDEYVEKYARCIEQKMPAAARQSIIDALQKSTEAWKQAASTEAGRSALAQACKAALDATKKATEAMGCTF